MNANLRDKVEKKVKEEIKSRMGDDGIYDVVNLSFDDFDFDFTDMVFDVLGGKDLDADSDFDVFNALTEDCELIARVECNRIICYLESAVEFIDGAFA